MLYSESKYQRIRALVKANHKWLKVALALRVKKLDLFSLVLKLGDFPVFDNFFPDLANFWDLNNFLIFNFIDFSIDLQPSSIIPTSLVANILSDTSIYDNMVVFNIDISDVSILLKP